jgi:hypothetical protein
MLYNVANGKITHYEAKSLKGNGGDNESPFYGPQKYVGKMRKNRNNRSDTTPDIDSMSQELQYTSVIAF